jgi:hypothetical protein
MANVLYIMANVLLCIITLALMAFSIFGIISKAVKDPNPVRGVCFIVATAAVSVFILVNLYRLTVG